MNNSTPKNQNRSKIYEILGTITISGSLYYIYNELKSPKNQSQLS